MLSFVHKEYKIGWERCVYIRIDIGDGVTYFVIGEINIVVSIKKKCREDRKPIEHNHGRKNEKKLSASARHNTHIQRQTKHID